MAQARNRLINLGPGKLTALARLGTLRDLDLQLVGIHQVMGGDAESRRRNLLDGASPPVAVGIRFVPRRVLTSLAGVGPRADAIHGNREKLVHLLAQRTVRHPTGGETADDVQSGLDPVT